MKKVLLVSATVVVIVVAAISPVLPAPSRSPASEADLLSYQSALERIAGAIERLQPDYPQLAHFSAGEHCDHSALAISYKYKAHPGPRTGGWTSGVPNPDADGIWFYIDFHDPESERQIHRQPVVPRYRYQDKEVMFLILEGEETKKLNGAILQILVENGVEPDTDRR